MSETFNDNPTKIREDEELDNAGLSNYLSNLNLRGSVTSSFFIP